METSLSEIFYNIKKVGHLLTASGEARVNLDAKGQFQNFKSHGVTAEFHPGTDSGSQIKYYPQRFVQILNRFDPTGEKRGILDEIDKHGYVEVHFVPIAAYLNDIFSDRAGVTKRRIVQDLITGSLDLVRSLEQAQSSPQTIIFGGTNRKMADFAIKFLGFQEVVTDHQPAEDETVYISTNLSDAMTKVPEIMALRERLR